MNLDWWLSPVLRPLPFGGLYFHRRSIMSFEKSPPHDQVRAYGAAWFGLEGDKGTEPSCLVVAEVDARRRLHIVECVHADLPFDQSIDWLFKVHSGMHRSAVEATAYPTRSNVYGVRLWQCPQEQYQAMVGDAVTAHIQREKLEGRDRSMPISGLPNSFDLNASARNLQSEIIAGRVLLPKSDPWVNDCLEELTQWPTVRSDARVRALCVLIAGLPAIVPPPRHDYEPAVKRGSGWAA